MTQAQREAESSGRRTGQVINDRLEHFREMTGGFVFAEVVRRYWEAHDKDDDALRIAALRWLRGEFASKTEARKLLDVREIIDDSNIYDTLKLMSAFVCAAGYKGLLVSIDEMVNLYKLTSSQARSANYEQILRILNDVLQGSAVKLKPSRKPFLPASRLGSVAGGSHRFAVWPRATAARPHGFSALTLKLSYRHKGGWITPFIRLY